MKQESKNSNGDIMVHFIYKLVKHVSDQDFTKSGKKIFLNKTSLNNISIIAKLSLADNLKSILVHRKLSV